MSLMRGTGDYELSVGFSTWLRASYEKRWPDGSPWAADAKNTWLFQANPDVWDFGGRLTEMDLGDEDDWSVSRFKQEITAGDRVLLWQSGRDAGLYAVGEISGPIFERDPDAEHFTEAAEELAVPFRLTRKVDPPIPRSQLLDHDVLKGLRVITAPQGSNRNTKSFPLRHYSRTASLTGWSK
jgi:hypothetical protein